MDGAKRGYSTRMTLALLIYAVLVVGTGLLTSAYPDAAWRYPVAVLPMVPFVYAIAAYVRFMRDLDEVQRRIKLEAFAIAFGATAAVTFCYGFLQHVGLPHVNWWFVWPVMGVSWIAGHIVAERRYR